MAKTALTLQVKVTLTQSQEMKVLLDNVLVLGVVPGTVDDFWRMVWDVNSKTIVMITKLKEQGRVSVTVLCLVG